METEYVSTVEDTSFYATIAIDIVATFFFADRSSYPAAGT